MSLVSPSTDATAVTAVVTTAPDATVAEELAARVVGERLAACANVLPGVTSMYWWAGEVQHDAEVLVVLKTVGKRFDALRDRITELHPYEVPEILAFPVLGGSDEYLEWVRREVEAR